ncbi:hypothetical protein KQI84_05270 [bacterium]|nr:hypothetical protein [bacterium]
MIAIVCPRPEMAKKLAELAGLEKRGVDGPCLTWDGPGPDGTPWRVYSAAGNADFLYATGRMAVRRGAELLVLLTTVEAAEEFLDRAGSEPDDLLLPTHLQDVSALEEIQRLCPDSAEKLPVDLPEKCQGARIATEVVGSGEELVLGSLAFPLTVHSIAGKSFTQWGVGLFDVGGIGLARAAKEERCPFLAACFLDKAVAPAGAPEESNLVRYRRLDNTIRHFISQLAEEETAATD